MDKKYSITIKDLETGEMLVNDEKTNAIIGAFEADEKGATAILFTECNSIDLIEILVTVENLVKKTFKENPELFLKRLLLDAIEKHNAAEEGGETE